MTPALVLGIGNILLKDEGVGVHVIKNMAQSAERGDPALQGIDIVDGGTFGPNLIDVIAHRRKVVIVDAVQAEGEPGTVLRFGPEDLAARTEAGVSLHQVGLPETLIMAERLGCAPRDVTIFGVIPQDISPGLELTEAVEAAVPKVVELIKAELRR
jgi:hydrogenase maturation protease